MAESGLLTKASLDAWLGESIARLDALPRSARLTASARAAAGPSASCAALLVCGPQQQRRLPAVVAPPSATGTR